MSFPSFTSPLPPSPLLLQVGQILQKATAGTGKKISLVLRGKSLFVLYDMADLDAAVEGVIDVIFFNQGQVRMWQGFIRDVSVVGGKENCVMLSGSEGNACDYHVTMTSRWAGQTTKYAALQYCSC